MFCFPFAPEFVGLLKARSGLLSVLRVCYLYISVPSPFPDPALFPELPALGFCPVRCVFFLFILLVVPLVRQTPKSINQW